MKEKVKMFWNRNKEDIKTGAILVLAPMAALGLYVMKGQNDFMRALGEATSQSKKEEIK